MSEDTVGGDLGEDLDSILARLRKIEGLRKSQTVLRGVCLGIIFSLIAFTGVTVYGSYKSLDSARFTENLKKELHQEFEPDLEKLAAEGESKLLPSIVKELEKSLKERLPRIQSRYEKMAAEKVEDIEKRFDQSALVYFREFEAALRRELPEKEMQVVFQKLKETENEILARISEDLRQEVETVRPKMERVQASLRALAEKPELRDLGMEEAKEMFLEATIDLLKYEIVRKRGEAVEKLGTRKNSGEVR